MCIHAPTQVELLRADLKSEMRALSRQLVSMAEARESPSIRDEQPAPCSASGLTAAKTTPYASEDLDREVTRSPTLAGTQQLRAARVREKCCCSHRGSHEGSHGEGSHGEGSHDATFSSSSTSTTTQGVTDHVERGSSEGAGYRVQGGVERGSCEAPVLRVLQRRTTRRGRLCLCPTLAPSLLPRPCLLSPLPLLLSLTH